LEELSAEHDRLLRKISKKRAALETTRELTRDLIRTFVARVEPLRQQLEALAGEVRELFEVLLGSASALSRRDQARVRRVYAAVIENLPLGLGQPPPPEAGNADFAEQEHATRSKPARRPRPQKSRQREDTSVDAGASAPKPGAQAPTLRSLFKRLVAALHPDKVRDETEKAERTLVMKDATRAFEAGDVARLIELERSFLASVPIGDDPADLVREAGQVARANTELRRQLRALTAEHKQLKLSTPFRIEVPAGDGARARAFAELERRLAGSQREVDEFRLLRDFVRRFATGGMGLAQFLVGPPDSDLFADHPGGSRTPPPDW
jgi:hypothetical protein